MAIDFEKTCDSMNHAFLIVTHKKYGFADSFIDWMKILLKNRELYVINGGHKLNILNSKEKLIEGIQYQHIFLFLHWKYFSL